MSKLVCIKNHQISPVIKQSRLKRDWMDDSYNKHAYRCLPVSTANVSGWEIILQQDVIVTWQGGSTPPRIVSGDKYVEEKDGYTHERIIAECSKIGMIDFRTSWSFRTEPGQHLWITGSPNYFVDGAVPLSASIPYDWWPDSVDISWKITKVNEEIVFPAGMPFAFISVYEPALMQEMEVEVQYLWDDIELINQRVSYNEAKFKKHREQPWTWMNGIRTGLNEKGERIGPRHEHLPVLKEPNCE